MPLLIVTTADSKWIKRSIGQALRSFSPNVPEHRFTTSPNWPNEVGQDDVVLVCGAKALEVLQNLGVVTKKRKVSSVRETPFKKPDIPGTYFVTYDPTLVASEPEKCEVIQWDVRLVVRYIRHNSLMPAVGRYRYVNSFSDIVEYVKTQWEKTKKPVPITCDTETEGFFPWYPDKDIVSIAFTCKPGMSDVLYCGPQESPVDIDDEADPLEDIRWLLTTPKAKSCFANGKYDLIWIAEKWGIECTNFTFDTMLAGSLLDENRENSLNMHAKLMTDMGGYDDPFNAKYDKGKMGEIPANEDFLVYAGGDTDAAHQVAEVLRHELLNEGDLAPFYTTVVHPAARAFERIERRGVCVDPERMAALRAEVVTVIADLEKKVLDCLPWPLRHKHRVKIAENQAEGKTPLTPAIVREFFFTKEGLNLKPKMLTPTGLPATTKPHLALFAKDPKAAPMIAANGELNRARKLLSTYIDGFNKHLRPNGRYHPTYFLGHSEFDEAEDDEAGTITGRLSAKNPAFQTVPKKGSKSGIDWAKKLRTCYVAEPGKVIIEVDYAQGELKVVACMTGEQTMLEAYQKGLDLHAVTGAKLAGIPFDEFITWKGASDPEKVKLFELHRGNAKPANFGLLYGQQVPGFMRMAWANYGVAFTEQEATVIRNAFFELYPGLLDYHRYQTEFVYKHGYVVSPLGRVRHLPAIHSFDKMVRLKAERQAINSPVQSCLNDLMLWTLAEINRQYPNGEIAVFGVIHDAFVAYVDEDKVVERVKQIKAIMENLPLHELGWEPQLKFTCDAKAGPDLAHLEEVKIAA